MTDVVEINDKKEDLSLVGKIASIVSGPITKPTTSLIANLIRKSISCCIKSSLALEHLNFCRFV